MSEKTDFPVNKIKPVLLLLLLVLALIQLMIPVANHYYLRSYAFDYSAYNFAFYDYAHFRISPCPIYLFPYPVTFLQDHFSLTLMLFAPLYWILGGITQTYTLLIIQWVIVLFGARATYKLILMKTEDNHLSLMSGIYYFILLGRYTSAAGDCNLAIMGSAFVPVFLYYFEKEKWTATLVCFLLLVFNREDYSLWLIFICGFLMVLHRKDRLKLKRSGILLLLSVLFFIIIFQWIIPGLEDENKKYTLFNFAVLGKTPGEAFSFILHHPWQAFKLLYTNHSDSNYYNGIKQEFYWVYFLSGGFLLFYRPYFLLPFIPVIAKKMYNDDPLRWSMESFYSIEIVALLPILVFFIIARMGSETLKVVLAWMVCCCTLIVSGFETTKSADKHIALLGDTRKFNFADSTFYASDYNLRDIRHAMRIIPDTAAVSASGKLSQHLAFRKKIYFFPRIDDAQYVFVLKKNDNWPISQQQADTLIHELLTERDFEVLIDKADFWLLRKKRGPRELSAVPPLFYERRPEPPAGMEKSKLEG